MNEINLRISKINRICFGNNNVKFADAIGTSESNLRNYQKNMIPKADLIAKICEVLNINPEWLLTGRGKMFVVESNCDGDNLTSFCDQTATYGEDQKSLPLLPFGAVAGYSCHDNDGVSFDQCQERLVIPEFIQRGAEFLIKVTGDSMEPKYTSGDILGCKTIKEIMFFQWGKTYVIDSSQGQIVKRIFEDKENKDNIICVSENSDKYPPFTLPKAEIRSISLVVAARMIRYE